ncbi:MAG: hypothetical protein V1898_04950 [Patescibacteria group bacterium]
MIYKNLVNSFFPAPYPVKSTAELEQLFLDFSVEDFFNFLKNVDIGLINEISNQRVLELFNLAAHHVPAYKDFLKKNNINSNDIKDINDFSLVPIMDKSNYLNKYSIEELSWDGKLNGHSMLSVSSGTSGKPYYWPRSIYLEYETAITHEIFCNMFFDIKNKKTLVIVAYAMGMYVAGTFTLNSFSKLAKKGYKISVVSPGLDETEVLRIAEDLYQDYDQIILAGYPPFVKDILDYGIANNISLDKYNLKFIFGAENFSEEWRSYVLNLAGHKSLFKIPYYSMNTYGSADCAILGHETPFSIKYRRFIKSQNMERIAFNCEHMPTLVQFNPFVKYFELVNQKLIFSANGGIPLIRYNINDLGNIVSHKELCNKLKINFIDSDFSSENKFNKFPFLYLYGRAGNTVTIYGVNIYYENIKMALENQQIIHIVSGKFSLKTTVDKGYNQSLEIDIELSTKKDASNNEKGLISTIIQHTLEQNNLEYKKLKLKIGSKAIPKINFYLRNHFKQIKSKHKWIEN